VIFIVLVVGFTNSLYVLEFNGPADTEMPITGAGGWLWLLNHCFQILTGGFDTALLSSGSGIPFATTIVAIIYAIVVVILLLNILIAMMNKTFEDVWSSASVRWILERGKIVHSIQSEMNDIHNNESARYWVDLQARPDELQCANCTIGSEDIKHKGLIRRIMNIECKWHD